MKKLFLLLALISFSCCNPLVNLDNRTRLLELGMTRQDAVKTLKSEYIIESKSMIRDGEMETLRFNPAIMGSNSYLLYFVNNRLVEFHKYQPPVQPEVRVIHKD